MSASQSLDRAQKDKQAAECNFKDKEGNAEERDDGEST
jgi:hypothetical protein